MKNFHDNAHANNRLSRCFVCIKINGKWVTKRISEATKQNIVCNDGEIYDLHSDDVKITFDNLGYVNTQHQAIFLSRTPKRMWKAGLVPENIQAEHIHPQHLRHGDMVEFDKCLDKLMNNVYPSYHMAYLRVKNGKCAASAFHRNFAVSLSDFTEHLVLYYKNYEIGFIDNDSEQIVVGDSYTHLREQIFEATGMECIS